MILLYSRKNNGIIMTYMLWLEIPKDMSRNSGNIFLEEDSYVYLMNGCQKATGNLEK